MLGEKGEHEPLQPHTDTPGVGWWVSLLTITQRYPIVFGKVTTVAIEGAGRHRFTRAHAQSKLQLRSNSPLRRGESRAICSREKRIASRLAGSRDAPHLAKPSDRRTVVFQSFPHIVPGT